MKTQAWGWLAAGVLAAGLNASYHDGGLRWAHQVADHVAYNVGTVIALATGHVDQLASEARMVTARNETSSCPLTAALARVQGRADRSDRDWESFNAMSAEEQAQLARIAADGARIEARVARIRIPAVAVNAMVVPSPHISVCPRLRVNVPRIHVPAVPRVRVELPAAGPV